MPVGDAESLAVIVNDTDPEAVGVPLITPVLLFKLNPAGNEPIVTEYVYGLVPRDAVTVSL